jgi:hypothetical protein
MKFRAEGMKYFYRRVIFDSKKWGSALRFFFLPNYVELDENRVQTDMKVSE